MHAQDASDLHARRVATDAQGHRGGVEVGDDVVPALSHHPFPGNVRELRSLIFDAVYRMRGSLLTAGDLQSLPGAA